MYTEEISADWTEARGACQVNNFFFCGNIADDCARSSMVFYYSFFFLFSSDKDNIIIITFFFIGLFILLK